jgi:hypothetical protein
LAIVESNGLSGDFICIVTLCKYGGREVAEAGLLALPVIEDFNVLGDLLYCQELTCLDGALLASRFLI